MPTRRFYKLPEEKRRRIRDAAVHEFGRVPAEMVSINRIIQMADISRGSYYTYFENKWDILQYLMEESMEQLVQCAEKCLLTAEGDLWKMMELFLKEILVLCSEWENEVLLNNIFSEPSQKKVQRRFWEFGGRECGACRKDRLEEKVYQQCVGKSVVSMSREYFSVLFRMLLTLVGVEIRSYIDGDSMQEIQRRFQMQLQILRCSISTPVEPDSALEAALKAEAG